MGPDGKTADSLANDLDKNGNGILDSLEGGKTRQVVKGEGTNILLLGSDQRSGQEAATVSGARADTIMLMHIPKNGEGVYLVSIMRDSWVSIPGYGNAKVNAALNYGGISLQIETIEQLIGVKIDHVAEIDFDGFKGLTNALGGVDVQVPFAFQTGVWNFTPGTMHMDGSTALAFVRERYSLHRVIISVYVINVHIYVDSIRPSKNRGFWVTSLILRIWWMPLAATSRLIVV